MRRNSQSSTKRDACKLQEAEDAQLQDQELDGEEFGPETQALLFGDMEVDSVTKESVFSMASGDDKVLATPAEAPAKKHEIIPSKNVEVNPNKNLEITPNKNLKITPDKNLKITPDKNLKITPDKNLKITLVPDTGKVNSPNSPSEVLLGCASNPTLKTRTP